MRLNQTLQIVVNVLHDLKALYHYIILDKARLTLMERGQNAGERWRTLEIVGGRRGSSKTQRVSEIF